MMLKLIMYEIISNYVLHNIFSHLDKTKFKTYVELRL